MGGACIIYFSTQHNSVHSPSWWSADIEKQYFIWYDFFCFKKSWKVPNDISYRPTSLIEWPWYAKERLILFWLLDICNGISSQKVQRHAICMYILSLALKSKRIYVTIFFSSFLYMLWRRVLTKGDKEFSRSTLYTCICQILIILRKWGKIDRSKFQHLFQLRSLRFLPDF